MATNQILVVDDEIGIRELLSEILEDEGYKVQLAENASQARAQRLEARPDLVLLDIWMPDTDGITLLKEWASSGLLTMPVVVMSGYGTIDTAVEANRIGAFDFLEKPIGMQKLLSTVGRALKRSAPQVRPQLTLTSLGKSQVISELKKRLEQIANLNEPLLLVEEVGAGAELCARFLHQPNTPWVALDDNAPLAEAPQDLLDQASHGVLYLSEIGALTRPEQRGLLLLIDKLAKRNVRLVCVTSKALPALVSQGVFDGALYRAVGALTLHVPSLREHREDIPELARLMLARCVEAGAASLREFGTSALNVLRNYDWPGNLLQLENAVKTLALTALEQEISAEEASRVLAQFDLEPQIADHGLPLNVSLREARDAFERVYFKYHLIKERGNMSRVAEKVGLERTHLYRKLKQLGIKLDRRGHDQ